VPSPLLEIDDKDRRAGEKLGDEADTSAGPVCLIDYSPVGKLGDNFVDNSAEARFKVA
jgi:hypothetical protein